jgi:uncharacterized damage-inducible protein DinB
MRLDILLKGAHAYLSPPAALAGLSAEHATTRPHGAPHPIAAIVAHMTFWQGWFLDCCDGVAGAMPAPAARGWPAPGEWPAVLESFEAGFARALALGSDTSRVDRAVAPPIDFEPLSRYTVRDVLTHIALHNGHHLGQIVTLRQQLGAWPPPAGSWTW